MARVSKRLILTGLAVCLPCGVIGVLAYQWLAVEREARALRGTEAAARSISAVRDDLNRDLQAAARAAVLSLRAHQSAAPFAQPPTAPALFTQIYLIDRHGLLVAPSVSDAVTKGRDAYLAAIADPRWQQAVASARSLENAGRLLEAARALDDLLARAPPQALAAALWLARARVHDAMRRPADADAALRTLMDCCADARDEYGVSFAVYAAWKRAGLAARDPRAMASLAREVASLFDRGVLGSPDDQTQIELLSARLGASSVAADLVARAHQARASNEDRAADERVVMEWLREVGPPSDDPRPLIRPIRGGSSAVLGAAARIADGGVVVGIVDTAGLSDWLAGWSPAGASFRMSLQPSRVPADATAVLVAPLFPEIPDVEIVARPRTPDSAADRSREQLFVGAVMFGLVLTLAVGVLALRDAKREATTAAARSAFVAGVTHELKTPLASIRLLAETLRWGRSRPEVRDELLETILEETDRLGRLVDNVLTSSRIESGATLYRPQLLVLSDVVRMAARRFESVARKDGFQIIEDIPEATLHVRADADALGQAVLNLLVNAAKYSGDSRRIEIAVADHGSQVEVRVVDHGIGVPASEQSRIFDSFYRSPTASAHVTGAGLGLALVRHFAEAHGGRVTVTSEPGLGSTFSIWLPLAPHVAAEPASVSVETHG